LRNARDIYPKPTPPPPPVTRSELFRSTCKKMISLADFPCRKTDFRCRLNSWGSPCRGSSLWVAGGVAVGGRHGTRAQCTRLSLLSLLLSSLELSDKKVHEPCIRARLGTAAHFCEVVVLKLRTTRDTAAMHASPAGGTHLCGVHGSHIEKVLKSKPLETMKTNTRLL